jgi:hypothetical protein
LQPNIVRVLAFDFQRKTIPSARADVFLSSPRELDPIIRNVDEIVLVYGLSNELLLLSTQFKKANPDLRSISRLFYYAVHKYILHDQF